MHISYVFSTVQLSNRISRFFKASLSNLQLTSGSRYDRCVKELAGKVKTLDIKQLRKHPDILADVFQVGSLPDSAHRQCLHS